MKFLRIIRITKTMMHRCLFALSIITFYGSVCFGQQNIFPGTGDVGIGTITPENSDGLDRVLEVFGSGHSKILASANGVRSGLWTHSNGYIGAPTGGMIGTQTNHAFSILTNHSPKLTITPAGFVGIGTTNPTEKLSVNGKVRAHEIKVEMANWPDYVFSDGYKLTSLAETEAHIKKTGHLPGIPSAKEAEAEGVDLGEMNRKLLEKIEELTLHLIRQEKEIQNLKLNYELKDQKP